MSRAKRPHPDGKPLIERVAELSMSLSQRHLSAYGATRSRHDFTQRQLMSCLILRAYLKTTYRGVLDLLASSQSLCQCLGLTDKLPHFTTLQKFSARSQVVEIAQQIVTTIGQSAAAQNSQASEAAMDAIGLERTTISDYFAAAVDGVFASGSKCRWWCFATVCCRRHWLWILTPRLIAPMLNRCWISHKKSSARPASTPMLL